LRFVLSRWWLALFALLFLAIRIVGVQLGLLYDPPRTRFWEVLFVIAAAGFLLFAPWRRRSGWTDESGGRFERALFFLGLPPALIALVALAAPPGNTTSGEPACRDTLVKGAPLLATTYEGGANGRSIPGRLGPATARFAGECVLGLDAYCLADPVQDLRYPDQWLEPRWLRIHRNEGLRHTVSKWINGESDADLFVSGGVVLPQKGVEYSDLQRLDEGQCGPQARKPAAPASLTPRPPGTSKDGLTFVIDSEHAVNFGLAVYIEALDEGDQYQQVLAGLSPSIAWKYAVTATRLRTPTSRVVVLGTPCIATNIPADASTAAEAFYRLGSDGTLSELPSSENVPLDMERLQRTACLSSS
jgi:hypothetical protein